MLLRFPSKNQPEKPVSHRVSQLGQSYSVSDMYRSEHQVSEEQLELERNSRNTSERAFRMLSIREHSVQELTRKLLAKGHAEKLVLHVISDLKKQGLVSDQRFAESFVRSRISRGQGPILICAELRDRGVSERILEDVITHTTEFWLQLAWEAREKRFGSSQSADISDKNVSSENTPEDYNLTKAYWTKQARFLSRRGFPADVVYRVLERGQG